MLATAKRNILWVYLRHSAFLTINGGIRAGVSFRAFAFIQLLLLGYQRIGLIGIFQFRLRFFNLLNIDTCLENTKSPGTIRPKVVSTQRPAGFMTGAKKIWS